MIETVSVGFTVVICGVYDSYSPYGSFDGTDAMELGAIDS
jgi:hypothetical protein